MVTCPGEYETWRGCTFSPVLEDESCPKGAHKLWDLLPKLASTAALADLAWLAAGHTQAAELQSHVMHGICNTAGIMRDMSAHADVLYCSCSSCDIHKP